MARRQVFTFSHPIAFAAFNAEGTMLVARSEDQTAYVVAMDR